MENSAEGERTEPGESGAAPKKPYAAPVLHVYGDVASLTRNVSNKSTNADGGHGAMSKTH